ADVSHFTRVLRLAGDMVARPGSQVVGEERIIDRPELCEFMGVKAKSFQQGSIPLREPSATGHRDRVFATATTKAVTDIIDRFVLRPQLDEVFKTVERVLQDSQRAG